MLGIEFNLSTLILLAFSLINFPLSVWIFIQNRKSWTNRLFSLLIIFLTVYLVVNTELYIFEDYTTRLFLGRFIMANGAIINLLVFLFLSVFPSDKLTVNRKVYIPILIVTMLLAAAAFTNLIFKSIQISENNVVTPEPGMLLPVFGLHTIGLILAGMINIIRRRKTSSGIDKIRINYIFFAVAVLFTLIIIFNFLLPTVFQYGNFVPFLPVYILLFLGIVSYAIVRHRLFGLRVLATQVLTAVFWMILLSNLFNAQDNAQRIINGVILLASIISGILLIRSVIREVEQRERLEELTEKLRAMDKQKDEFISMAAHELRAPMTAIKGYLSMVVEGDTGDIPEKARGFLADANAINERLIRLVNNMLNVSRIEEGRMVYQIEIENLSQVVRTVFAQFKPEAERKGLEYGLNIPAEIKDSVQVDPDRIHEVVANLLSNAVKYTDQGYVRVQLVQPDKGSVRFEVKDTGPGISKEEQVKLFRKFHRVESNVGKTTGTGLGLYICKLLVEKFGGEIGLTSSLGKGSIFWFQLPLKFKSAAGTGDDKDKSDDGDQSQERDDTGPA
jgi:signal transduction histidine kinase